MAMTDAFCAAAAEGNTELVKGFILRRADPNQRSSDGFLPLCLAAFWGNSDIVKLLLENGANVNGRNSGTQWTACHCAAFQGHGKVIMILLEYKPNLELKDDMSRTAVDFASALDSIWPHFAAKGCKRTSKQDLIRLRIVEKTHSKVEQAGAGLENAYFSRPGSAYIVKAQPLNGRRTTLNITDRADSDLSEKQYVALSHGDVLTETPGENLTSNDKSVPLFSAWRT